MLKPRGVIALPRNTFTAIEFQDRETIKVKKSNATVAVTQAGRVRSKPEILSVTESDSTDSAMTFSYEVVEHNPDFSVTTLFALVSAKPIRKPLPSKIASDPAAQSFSLSGPIGSVVVAMDTGVTSYVYFVARNDETTPVLSGHFKFANEPFSIMMPTSVRTSKVSGLPQIASAVGGRGVGVAKGMTAYSSAKSATAHLIMYEQGDPQIPADAAAAKAQLDAGATNASGRMTD